MKLGRTTFAMLLASAVTAVSTLATPVVAETELVMSSWLPPRHTLVVNAMKPWARQVAEVTDGRVTVRVLGSPAGAPPAHFDMAAEGIADITYGLHSFTTDDRFLGSRIGQFSFIGDDAVSGSKAFWTVYSGALEAQKEHMGVKLLGLFVHGPGVLHNNVRKVETPEDMKGLNMRVAGPMYIDVMNALGANPQQMQWGETITALQQGVVDGQENPLALIRSANFNEVQAHVNQTEHVRSWIYLTIAESTWGKLSADDQAAVTQAAAAAQEYERSLLLDSLAADQAYLEENGMTFVEVDGAAFQAAARDAVLANVSDEIKPIVEGLFAN